jgi:hypothetical protein
VIKEYDRKKAGKRQFQQQAGTAHHSDGCQHAIDGDWFALDP